jgi:hypothetical protein
MLISAWQDNFYNSRWVYAFVPLFANPCIVMIPNKPKLGAESEYYPGHLDGFT